MFFFQFSQKGCQNSNFFTQAVLWSDSIKKNYFAILNAKTFQGQRYGNVPFLQEVEVDNQMYLIKTEIDEGAEGPEYENFCDPTNQENCNDLLFEVKEELNEGGEGAEGPEYETFCDPTKGQVISEWKFDVLNFPKKQRRHLMNFCPRIG